MHNIESPNASDSAIEQEMQAKGLTAPRITHADVLGAIRSTYYFTARQGAEQACRDAGSDLAGSQADGKDLGLLTVCVLVLKNGFTALGASACVSQENFDAEIGRRVARESAEEKIWPLLGYALKQRLYSVS